MYLYLLLVIPAFAPGRIDRLVHPGEPGATGPSSDDS